MKKLKEIFNSLNFTRGEKKTILFLVIIIVAGFSFKYAKHLLSSTETYDYSSTDKEFYKGAEKINSVKYGLIIKDTNPEEVNLKELDTLTLDNEQKIQLEKKLNLAEDSLKFSKSKKNKKEKALEGKLININLASKEELMALPGIGETMAERIIVYRKDHNGFKKIEDIMKVKGIGKKKFEKLKNYITVN